VTFLALDIGNTSTNAALFRNGRLIAHGRLPTNRLSHRAEPWLLAFLKGNSADTSELDGLGIASAVPSATETCRRFCRDRLHHPPFVITGGTHTRLVNRCRPARSLGPDRLVAALAASHFYRPPLICASFGTATVVDAVSADFEFLGGAIIPGVRLFTEALSAHTALLPHIEPTEAASPIGDNTVSALRAGAIFGSAGALEGLVRHFRMRLGRQARLVITGGYAALVMPHLRGRFFHRPHLALEGIWLAWCDAGEKKR